VGSTSIYPPCEQDAWKGPVKAALLLLAVGCVSLNAAAAAIDITGSAYSDSVAAFAYFLFAACIATGAVLIVRLDEGRVAPRATVVAFVINTHHRLLPS
jgi:hypothetical protein